MTDVPPILPTGKLWDGNQRRDPQQLLLEAAQMEARAEEHFRIAEFYLDRLVGERMAARRLMHAAANYCQWAAGKFEMSI